MFFSKSLVSYAECANVKPAVGFYAVYSHLTEPNSKLPISTISVTRNRNLFSSTTIDYLIRLNTDITITRSFRRCLTFLDIKRAFDRVQYYELFYKVLLDEIPVLFVQIIYRVPTSHSSYSSCIVTMSLVHRTRTFASSNSTLLRCMGTVLFSYLPWHYLQRDFESERQTKAVPKRTSFSILFVLQSQRWHLKLPSQD